MKAIATAPHYKLRVILALIMLLLFARTAVAFHDSVHATVLDDHCQIAQLEKNSSSTLPITAVALLPFYVEAGDSEVIQQCIPATAVRRFLIRAPPVSY